LIPEEPLEKPITTSFGYKSDINLTF